MWHDVTWCDSVWSTKVSFALFQHHTYSAIQQRIKYCCISTIREKAMPARYSRLFTWIPKSVFPRIHNHLAFATWFRQRTLSSGHQTQLPGDGMPWKRLGHLPLGIGASGQIPQDSTGFQSSMWQDSPEGPNQCPPSPSPLPPCRAMQSHAGNMKTKWKRNETK